MQLAEDLAPSLTIRVRKAIKKEKGRKSEQLALEKRGRSAAASKAVENQRKDKGNRAKSSGGTGSVRFRREGFH
jgi:hypothetical protein